ncbi:MAG: ComGF family competence protein [Streptococcaceae bacterium]|nr:ComGF family competence protein [Streptococcaceae bacterium]
MNKKIEGFAIFESLLSLFILSQFLLLFFLIFKNINIWGTKYLYERDLDYYSTLSLLEKEIVNANEVRWQNEHHFMILKELEFKVVEFFPKAKEIRIKKNGHGYQPLLRDIAHCSFQKENDMLKIYMRFIDNNREYSDLLLIPSKE